MITREVVRQFFRDNKLRGIELGRDMLWGYFFVHDDPEPLEKLRPVLEPLGYKYVGILGPDEDDEDNDPETYFLHVERVEEHSSASLYQRCEELAALARKHNVQSFDGFEVGKVDGSVLTS